MTPTIADVWTAPLDADERLLAEFRATLSPAEREREARFAFDRERRAFACSRGRLRALLSRYAKEEPAAVVLVEDALGKPRLAGACGQGRFRFSVSHSAGRWACAVALHREVGLDLEWIDPERDVDRLSDRYFSPAEARALRALPEGDRRRGFHLCWTRKEAWLKARGFGLSLPLDSFDVSLAPDEPARILATRPDPADASKWTLLDLDLGAGFAAALAVEGTEPVEVRVRGT